MGSLRLFLMLVAAAVGLGCRRSDRPYNRPCKYIYSLNKDIEAHRVTHALDRPRYTGKKLIPSGLLFIETDKVNIYIFIYIFNYTCMEDRLVIFFY